MAKEEEKAAAAKAEKDANTMAKRTKKDRQRRMVAGYVIHTTMGTLVTGSAAFCTYAKNAVPTILRSALSAPRASRID